MSSITTVRHGTGAIQALWDLVKVARDGDVLAPAAVVVHSSAQASYIRTALARIGGVAGVQILPSAQFVRQLADGPLLSVRRRPAQGIELQAAIQAALADTTGRLKIVANHRSTLQRLVDLAAALEGLPKEVTERLRKSATGLSAESLEILRDADQRMENVISSNEIFEIALETLDVSPPGFMGPIILFNPRPQNPLEGRLLAALAGRSDSHIIAGLSGNNLIDANYKQLLNGWGVHISDVLVESNPGVCFDVSDPEDEIDVALRELMGLATAGVPLHSMAILYPHADPYASICRQRLEAAGIPHCGPDTRTLADSMVARTLLRLFDLVLVGLDRSAVLNVVRSAPICDADGKRVPAEEWDQITRSAGVVGADSWTTRLDDYLRLNGARLDGPERADLESEIESLKRFVADLDERLQELQNAHSWSTLVSWSQTTLATYLPSNLDWPESERKACQMFDRVLEGLENLEHYVPHPTLEQFRSLLESEIERQRLQATPYGTGLLVTSIEQGAGLGFEQVVVVGLSEGTFPRTKSEDPLLTDQLRAVAGRHLPPTSQSTANDSWLIASVLSGSRRPGIVTFSRSELRSTRARIWPKTIDPLVGQRFTIDSHYQGVVKQGRPVSVEDFNIRELSLHTELGEPIESHPLIDTDAALASGLRRVRNRRSQTMTTHVGQVSPHNLDIDNRLFSPTALETYAGCPRRYLLGRVLRISEQERPEQIEELSARDRGSLLHRIVERFIGEAIEHKTVPAPDEEWSEEQQARLFEIAAEEVARVQQLGLSGGEVQTRISWRSLRHELHNFVMNDNELRSQYQSTPIAVEFEFGFDGNDTVFTLEDGKEIRLRGSVDRVDTTADGDIIVIDYKTGSSRGYTKIDANPLDEGRRLQLPIYGSVMADRFETHGDKLAMYWMTREAKQIKLSLTPEVEVELESTISNLLGGISSGYFPAIPGDVVGYPRVTFENCTFCEFDRICPRDRQREWSTLNTDQLSLRELVKVRTNG